MKKLFYAEFEPLVKKTNFIARTSCTGEANSKNQFILKIHKELGSKVKIVSIMEL